MGNSQKIIENKDSIIWLDKNVYNDENKLTYKSYQKKLEKFNFLCFKSVSDLISFIKNNLNYFEFRLFYIVVSGKLAEEFYNEYVKITEKYNIIAASIVYCYKQKYHEKKPYFKDKFLNSGGITCNFDYVVKYILNDECNWDNIHQTYKKYIPEKPNYGDVFMYMNTSKEYELALPILIGNTINSSLIEKGEIKKFQELLLSRYSNSYTKKDIQLIKPSGNKNMDIPLHILSKFFAKFYTSQSIDGNNFYSKLNLDLTNNKFDEYHPFIFLMYDSLNKGYLKSYKKKLYRGGKILKSEFDKIITNKNKCVNNNEKLFYFSKNFLSFSKDEQVAKDPVFFNNQNYGNTVVTVEFIIEKCENEKYFITNIDIESLSNFRTEKEVLILPLTCFEVVKIGDEEEYKNVKYRKIYLSYLDKYLDKIIEKINELNNKSDKKEIDNFFTKSMNSKFGKNVIDCYDKKQKLSLNYCKVLRASPYNNYFLSIIATDFFSKIIVNSKGQIGAHLDDEVPNFLEEYNGSNESKNRITKFFERMSSKFKELDHKTFNNSYSIGFCLGSFLSNFESFVKAPTSAKAFSLASLALGCGLPLIKMIPKIKFIIGVEILNSGINVGMLLNGLNILWGAGVLFGSIFKFHFEHQNRWRVTGLYIAKLSLKTTISIGFSVLGNLACKAACVGIIFLIGAPISPFVTIVAGILGGVLFGALGNYAGNKLTDKIFGKDEFILTSANLYYKYIPEKYRKRGNNPHLQWNKTYLCAGVKSYIIECIINDVDTGMRVINIPNDIFELEECLGYEINQNYPINEFFSEDSTDDDEDGKKFICKKLKKGKKYAGDLVIPYKGIDENAYKIDFIIYGINKEKISSKEWSICRDKESKEKLILVGFVLSVY